MLLLSELQKEVPLYDVSEIKGKVVGVQGPTVLARFPRACLGDICCIEPGNNDKIYAQVVSFNEDVTFLAPFSAIKGIAPGALVTRQSISFKVQLSENGDGLVVDALGNVMRPLPPGISTTSHELQFSSDAPDALGRNPIDSQMHTGIKSIDTLCSIGYGQRIGLFASAGMGKSTLLGMLARNADVDVNVIALIGERGREVPEFINDTLGKEGLSKSVLVVATSDQSALQRSLAAVTATSIAEHYRSQGKRVLLLVDSLTRMARAIRDVSLAAGELPIRQGLTASVYSELPRLIERAGNDHIGSITAIYTLLDTSEYELDPLAEEVKSLLDGHISLDSSVANKGIRPAVDFTRSISRVMDNIHDEDFLGKAQKLRSIIARLKKDKDLVLLGGQPDIFLKACLTVESEVEDFLKQKQKEKFSFQEINSRLDHLLDKFLSISKGDQPVI